MSDFEFLISWPKRLASILALSALSALELDDSSRTWEADKSIVSPLANPSFSQKSNVLGHHTEYRSLNARKPHLIALDVVYHVINKIIRSHGLFRF